MLKRVSTKRGIKQIRSRRKKNKRRGNFSQQEKKSKIGTDYMMGRTTTEDPSMHKTLLFTESASTQNQHTGLCRKPYNSTNTQNNRQLEE